MDLAAGFAMHTGWAHFVLLHRDGLDPVVVDRGRVELVPEGIERFAYHLVAEWPLAEAKRSIDRTHKAVAKTSVAVVDDFVKRAKAHGPLVAIAISGFPREVPELATVLASHARLHAAEGELFRGALHDAAEKRGVPVSPIHPKHGIAESARTMGVTPERLQATLDALRKQLGAPWTADHKLAAAGALAALGLAA